MVSALDQEEEKEEKMSRKLMSLVVAVFVVAGLSCPVLAGDTYSMSVSPGALDVEDGSTFQMNAVISSDSSDGEIQGWSFGFCHDACGFATLDSVDDADTATVNGGNPADFNNLNLFACGYTQGVVISFPGLNVLASGTTITMATGNYTATCAVDDVGTFAFCETLGSPPTVTVVVTGGASIAPSTTDATVTCIPPPPVSLFVRGDSNDSGDVNIADVIWLLYELFIPGSPTTDCAAADDSNSDGSVDTADAVYIANHLFLGGPAPGAPHPDCGLADGQEPDDCGPGNCG
jgi:hypothetical protein